MFFEPDLKNLPELSDTLKKSVSITFTANDGMSCLTCFIVCIVNRSCFRTLCLGLFGRF
jgi:hypothetical protein